MAPRLTCSLPAFRLSPFPTTSFLIRLSTAMAGSRRSSTKASVSYQEIDSDVDIDQEERVEAKKGEFRVQEPVVFERSW
jgi:hypothetical protein